MCTLFLVLPCINVIYVDDFRVIDKGKNTFVEVIRITSTCIPNVPFFFQTYLNSRDICLRYLPIFKEIYF